jgi:hypothetical protein
MYMIFKIRNCEKRERESVEARTTTVNQKLQLECKCQKTSTQNRKQNIICMLAVICSRWVRYMDVVDMDKVMGPGGKNLPKYVSTWEYWHARVRWQARPNIDSELPSLSRTSVNCGNLCNAL